MSLMEIVISCAGVYCVNKNKVTAKVDMPEGWTIPEQEICEGAPHHQPLCPDCAKQGEWFESVCPGCTSSPRECGLFRLFAYGKYSKGLNKGQRQTVKAGVCPVRINGTISFEPGKGFEDINISDRAPEDSGEAVLAGIDAYMAKYPVGEGGA